MTTGWRATVIVNYDQANLTSLSIGREKKHICTYLGKNKKKYRVFAFPERKELLRRISRPYQVLQMSRTWWVGGFAIFNKVEWSKRFTPGEGKMSNMPKAKAESPHIKWISQRKRLNHFPYATFQLAPFCRDECHTRCYKITHRGHNMFQYNRPVKFDIFPHLFCFFLPYALNRHVRFPIWPRSSWPSVPPCEPSCFFPEKLSVATGALTEIDWWL